MKPSLTHNFELRKDHPLKTIENIIPEMSLETIQETNKEIIVRDGVEIFIPSQFRGQLLGELHSTHLSTEPMKRLARGKFWWPGMQKDIEGTYTQCQNCKSEAISKIQKRCETRPIFLDQLSPGEILHLDYLEHDGKHIFILCDQYSGWSKYYLMGDMTSQSAIKSLKDYFHNFGLPHKIVSDSGPSFRAGVFKEFLQSHHILHHLTSSYRSQSAGLVE